ncbi:MAG TPA: hypothetical protein VGB13_12960 [Candidatus Krumholzibacteria bacterium]
MKNYLRPISALLALLTFLAACAPRHMVYSLDPVDAQGVPLPFDRAHSVRFEDGTEQSIAEGVLLRVVDDRLEISDGSVWPLSSVDAIDWIDSANEPQRSKLQSPSDLLDFDDLPRLRSVQLQDGEIVELGDDNPWSRWSDGQLGIEVSSDGEAFRLISLEEIHTVTLHPASLADATVKDWRFYAALAAAATIVWLVRPDTENLAIR